MSASGWWHERERSGGGACRDSGVHGGACEGGKAARRDGGACRYGGVRRGRRRGAHSGGGVLDGSSDAREALALALAMALALAVEMAMADGLPSCWVTAYHRVG